MSDPVPRAGRPKITPEENQALYRLARTHDGRTLLKRLQRIKEMRQELDLDADGQVSARNKGRIAEIMDIERDFRDASQPENKSLVNEQKRFS